MRRRLSALRTASIAFCLGAIALAGDDFTLASFTGATESPANRIGAAPDFRAPTVAASAIAKSAGGTPGFVTQSGTYFVYANVNDAGNPPSGVGAVSANVSAITTGATATALAAGSFSVGGVSYSHRSVQLTADAVLAEGARAYSVTAGDNAANGGTQAGFSVTIDNTVPSGSDVQTANGGATAGTAEAGDTATFTFSEAIDPASVLSGWTGASTAVVVRLINGGALPTTADSVQIWNAANSAQLPLGAITLPSGTYVGGLAATDSALFGATGTASTMVISGSTITITLGTAGGAQAAGAGTLAGAMSWVPSATATDRAGNATSTATVTETTPPSDTEF
ncbi:MAG: hypothetical protein QOD13_3233 [Thermoleophilaceae bacterium]|nr:hypothetical protein [Thermoleophilaceae bacterium]